MCDYCGCRDVEPIGELSDEHDEIAGLAGALRQRLMGGAAGGDVLVDLQRALGTHLRKEEEGLFAQLHRLGECAVYLNRLEADHARARSVLLEADPADAGAGASLLEGLDELAAHIEVEEHDFFPASRLLLDETSWSEVAAAHRRLAAGMAAPA